MAHRLQVYPFQHLKDHWNNSPLIPCLIGIDGVVVIAALQRCFPSPFIIRQIFIADQAALFRMVIRYGSRNRPFVEIRSYRVKAFFSAASCGEYLLFRITKGLQGICQIGQDKLLILMQRVPPRSVKVYL